MPTRVLVTKRVSHYAAAVLVVPLLFAACDRSARDITTTTASLTGAIVISGSVTGGSGLPVSGVTIHLDGSSQSVATTSAAGTYSFSGLAPGSYSVRPTRSGCSFSPDVVNLNNLTASVTQSFSSSGPSCGGAAAVNAGATSGPLTISGHVRDASGKPVVGSRITLSGSAQAVRFSDLTGGYTFHVAAGSYAMATAGACALTPASVNVNNLAVSRTQDFVAGPGCMVAQVSNVTSTGQVVRVLRGTTPLALTLTNVVQSTPAATTQRLLDIGAERTEPVRNLTIAGFPAIERQALIQNQEPGDPAEILGDAGETEDQIWLTTAIAVGDTVVRFETQLPDDASAATIDSFFAIARDFTPDEMASVHGPTPPPVPPGVRIAPAARPSPPSDLTPASVGRGFGEVAVAASDTATSIVYARNPGKVFVSLDAGATVNNAALVLNARTTPFTPQGDPSLAVGAPAPMGGTQAFYYSEIFQSAAAVLGGGGTPPSPARSEVAVFQSTDNGQTFNQAAGVAIDCSVAAAGCTLPDQSQLAADRVTRSAAGDRLYVAWRNFVPSTTGAGSAFGGIGIACSPDGGTTWSAANTTAITATGADFPRMAVGTDGSVFVAYETGSSGQDGAAPAQITLFVQKLTACNNSGATPTIAAVGNPVKIASGVGETAVVTGLDRRPATGQYQVAADDSDATGNRVFIVFVDEKSATGALGNADLRFAESTDGGKSFKASAQTLNRSATGHRYHPWMCSTKGIVYVTWYDRRDATVASNDLTAYFYSSLGDPKNTGSAVVGQEVNASGGTMFDDPQCLSGFLFSSLFAIPGSGAPRSAQEESLCSDLPALPTIVNSGTCQSVCAMGVAGPCGSKNPCDFRSTPTTCPMGESCTTGVGAVKYGDYNGAACAGGDLFMAWATATVPQGITCAAPGAACTVPANCCNGANCVGNICSPSGGFCNGNGSACANDTACCSGNCLGGTCRLGVGVYSSSTAVTPPLTCTPATSTPDASFSANFDVDTTLSPPAGGASGYGQMNCPNQFLVDVDLTQAAFKGKDVFVSGSWTTTLPAMPCNEQAVMTVFATTDGMTWKTWDTVVYAGVLQGSVCNAQAQSHTNSGSLNLGGTLVPSAQKFTHVRIAINATQSNARVPVVVEGQAL
jgi:hypothetical protein